MAHGSLWLTMGNSLDLYGRAGAALAPCLTLAPLQAAPYTPALVQ